MVPVCVAPVADFGMSRSVQEDEGGDYYRSSSGIIPVRWTAPEGLTEQKFSSASDVWSYAMTCIEIMQDGALPWHVAAATVTLAMLAMLARLLATLACVGSLARHCGPAAQPGVATSPVRKRSRFTQCWSTNADRMRSGPPALPMPTPPRGQRRWCQHQQTHCSSF